MGTEMTTKTMQHGACTIVIHRPVLSSAERSKREQAAREELGRALRDYVQRTERKCKRQ